MMRAAVRVAAALACALPCACTDDEAAGTAGPRAAAGPWFVDEAAERGLVFRHASGAAGGFLMPEIMGGGAALADVDGDGDLDAYLVQSGAVLAAPEDRPPNRMFENLGAGRFQDVTEGSGAGDRGLGMGVACGDADGDGDVDLYVTNVGRNTLLANHGGGTFQDATFASGTGGDAWSSSAAFFDGDADGFLDLYVCNYLEWTPGLEVACYGPSGARDYCDPASYGAPAVHALYRNRGDGTFADATASAGIAGHAGTGLGVVAGDFDRDGRADLFVANDGMPNFLWRNRGDFTFAEEARRSGCAVDVNGIAKAGMGVAAEDVDDDGDLDLFVCNLNDETDSLFMNEQGLFVDSTARRGLGWISRTFTRFGVGLVDFDHDGCLDVFEANGRVAMLLPAHAPDPYAEPNLLLRGTDAGYAAVPQAFGAAPALVATSRAAAFGDVDGDGAIDVLVVNRDGPALLLMNRVPKRGAALLLDVRERNGAPALGATVTARIGARTVTRVVRAAWSYQASNDPRVHVGLGAGDAPRLSDVRVTWSDGSEDAFGDFNAGGRTITLQRD